MKKYLEIFLDIKEKILANDYPSHSFLPSENQLSQQYQASRETIRKALALLLENGFIQKIQGKGSMVLERPRVSFPISGLTSYKEIDINQQMNSKTSVYFLKKEIVEKNSFLPFPEGASYWHLIRQRAINDEVVILDKDFLLTEFVPTMSQSIAEDSIYDYLEHEEQLKISYAQKEITVENTSEEDHRLMTLNSSENHVVVVRSKVFLEDASLFQYTESRHRIDKFKFVEFARRRH